MPSEPTQEQMDLVEPHFTARSIPAELIQTIWNAIDDAGLTVVPKAEEEGDPVHVTDSTPIERVRIAGMPGAFLVGIRVNGGFQTLLEQASGEGLRLTTLGFIAGETLLPDEE